MRNDFLVQFSGLRALLGVLTLVTLLSACGAKNGAPTSGAGGKPPPEVGVVTTELQPVAIQTELPGRVEPVRIAQVRARVNGLVLKRLFREGSEVKAGQALFQIDPASYQAALDSAQAALAKAQANLTQASAQAERYKPLVEANAVSKQEYLNVVAAQKQAEADVAANRGQSRRGDASRHHPADQYRVCQLHAIRRRSAAAAQGFREQAGQHQG